ncbi:DUF4205-containing protein [Aureococcus anophagefferens]|nr:DUF4205-containing protein [Aureococcus anophagefferens]
MPSRAGEPWSDKEVSNLKRAVRAVSDRVEKQDRWRQIATLVGSGRSKRECYDKYKALKAEKAELREAEAKGGRRAEALLAEDHRPRTAPPPQAAPKRADGRARPRRAGLRAGAEPRRPRRGDGDESPRAAEAKRAPARGPRPPAALPPAPIDATTAAGLRTLLLGDTRRQPPAAWKQQGLTFTDDCPDCGYGLVQHGGGPCGVLAAVQVHVLDELVFRAASPGGAKGGSDWRAPAPRDLEAALVEAVSRIIWRASTGGKAKVCAVEGKPFVDRSSTYAPDGLTEHVRVWDAESLDDVRSLVAYYARDLAQPRGAGVLSVLYSALLSRTLRGARDDMDEVAGERRFLVDRHGYASQEAVNLLLVGKAVTNVFDGERRLEDDVAGTSDAVVLRGIPSKCDLGFLTLHAAYGYYTVGAHLKAPRSPCWVVYSESHYSVLFAPDGVDGATFDLFYWDGLAGQDERIKLTVTRDHYDHVRKPPDPNDDRALIPPLDLVVRSKWPNAAVDWNDTGPIL